jgi:GTP pyrophosphokinase
MFEDEIFIFTPTGDLIKLPVDSTPLDFAFAIHSGLGFSCVRAKVNKKLVPLSYKLNNGDIVEMETSKDQKPNSGWLSFVKTSKASHAIGKYLRKVELEESIKIGNHLLEKHLRKLKIYDKLYEVKKGSIDIGYKNFNELLSDLGRGGSTVKDIITKIFPDIKTAPEKVSKDKEFIDSARSDFEGISLDGVKNLVVDYGKCCNPIPGDDVIGYISRGRGLIVHRLSCSNLSSLSESNDRIVSVNWDTKKNISFKVKIHITCIDSSGVLNEIADTISKKKINILDVKTDVTEGGLANIWIICKIEDLTQLKMIMKSISKLNNVDSVERVYS